MKEISAVELKTMLESPSPPLVLDVREEWEWQRAHVGAARLMPMGDVPAHLDELDRGRDLVVMCHHGGRSRQIVLFLEQQGYERAINLRGGIDAWSREVDPAVPLY
jgi:rhodanese-related sulfurtransferase